MMNDILSGNWNYVRWRIAMQFLLWGVNIAPMGDAQLDLIVAHLEWADKHKGILPP
jgi:hypothetical protein